MAERKSVNKYYPPDWDPSKGSINQYVGQHPLRDRAKKLGQGILVIRFEMPYNIWCGGCSSHIGMGVRYNAEKTKTGMYYTTPIYKFRMKCHLCDNYFEIQTDPKNHDYVILEGARRKEQRWDPKENGQIETEDKGIIKKMATDAMFKLEHGSDDVVKGQKAKTNLTSLETRREDWKDDYLLNKLARQKFREEKKVIKSEADMDAALLAKSSLEIPLQQESERDVKLASLIKYRALETYDERQAKKRKEIESRPLFQSAKQMKTAGTTPEHMKLKSLKTSIRSAKAGSPFDRMKMNTLVGGNPISKEVLGIKKKTLPNWKTQTNHSEASLENSSSDKQENEDQVSEYTETDDLDTVNESSMDSRIDSNSNIQKGESDSETLSRDASKDNCDKHGEGNTDPESLGDISIATRTEITDKVTVYSQEIEHQKGPPHEETSNCDKSKSNTKPPARENKRTEISDDKPQKVLSLVSAYSDSDSESSASG